MPWSGRTVPDRHRAQAPSHRAGKYYHESNQQQTSRSNTSPPQARDKRLPNSAHAPLPAAQWGTITEGGKQSMTRNMLNLVDTISDQRRARAPRHRANKYYQRCYSNPRYERSRATVPFRNHAHAELHRAGKRYHWRYPAPGPDMFRPDRPRPAPRTRVTPVRRYVQPRVPPDAMTCSGQSVQTKVVLTRHATALRNIFTGVTRNHAMTFSAPTFPYRNHKLAPLLCAGKHYHGFPSRPLHDMFGPDRL